MHSLIKKILTLTVNPHRKYHGTEEKTERSLDLLFNKGCEQLSEELEPVKKGDVINLHDLLFTKNRDYLVRYNAKEQVYIPVSICMSMSQ